MTTVLRPASTATVPAQGVGPGRVVRPRVPGPGGAGWGHVEVSVLVPVLDEGELLAPSVERMLAQRFDGGVEFLFVDGGSRDGSREYLRALAERDPRVRLLDNPRRRTPQALNIALAAARGTWVARMDAHTVYPEDYLARGVARLRAGGVASVSGPQVAVGDGRGWSRRVALALATPLGVGGARFRRTPQGEVEVDSGFTGLWSRELLLRHGGWDEEWLNDQDTELAARLRAEGGRIVCLPEMAAAYAPRASLRALAQQYRNYGWYRVKTSHRHPSTLRRSQLLPASVLLTAALAPTPGPVGRAARAGTVLYATVLALSGVRAPGQARDRLALPVVHAVMHGAYGAGFLQACVQLGPPLPALRRVLKGGHR